MLLILYDSRTGNVQRFINKLDKEKYNLKVKKLSPDLTVDEKYVLVTYTTGFGKVPESTLKFLEYNHKHLVGVSSSGNRNWGTSFAKSALTISELYNVPVITQFELSGTSKDTELFYQRLLEESAWGND
ncbi:hypothetical protein HSE3_gp059 [Bacillus phage vB_BceM-HSE3]|nr:hypothetical protein HSE3_gp059 [Bacillus phage vB_BceM-HSE3]